MRKHSFPPVTDDRTRLLILGSLPGERSLAAGEYYAHPQNRFWDLVGAAIRRDLRSLDYADRLATLLDHGIGLWDVIAHAYRQGSLDSAIRDAAENDLEALLRALPQLEAIALNGRKAAKTLRMVLGDAAQSYRLIDLPSSSPAYAAMPFDQKRKHWMAIADLAAPAASAIND